MAHIIGTLKNCGARLEQLNSLVREIGKSAGIEFLNSLTSHYQANGITVFAVTEEDYIVALARDDGNVFIDIKSEKISQELFDHFIKKLGPTSFERRLVDGCECGLIDSGRIPKAT